MEPVDPLQRAIDMVGLSRLARECQVTHQAVRKWQRQGRMPRTEWTGEMVHADNIARITCGAVSRDDLLKGWPKRVEAEGAGPGPVETTGQEVGSAA